MFDVNTGTEIDARRDFPATFVPPGLAAWALPASWDYVRFMAREGTPVLGLPFSWVFLPFALLLVALVVRSAVGVWRALRGLDLDDAGVSAA